MGQTTLLVRQHDGTVKRMTQQEQVQASLPRRPRQEPSREDKLMLAEEQQHRMWWLRYYIDG